MSISSKSAQIYRDVGISATNGLVGNGGRHSERSPLDFRAVLFQLRHVFSHVRATLQIQLVHFSVTVVINLQCCWLVVCIHVFRCLRRPFKTFFALYSSTRGELALMDRFWRPICLYIIWCDSVKEDACSFWESRWCFSLFSRSDP